MSNQSTTPAFEHPRGVEAPVRLQQPLVTMPMDAKEVERQRKSGAGTGERADSSATHAVPASLSHSPKSSSSSSSSSSAEREQDRAVEHGSQAAGHAQAATKHATLSAQDKASVLRDKLGDTISSLSASASSASENVEHTVLNESERMKKDLRAGWHDTKRFARLHPWTVFSLLLLSFLSGAMWFNAGFYLPVFRREPFMMHPRSSPQFRAHKALETVLDNYYGTHSSSLTGQAAHKMQAAWHHLTDILGSSRSGVFDRSSASDWGIGSKGSSWSDDDDTGFTGAMKTIKSLVKNY